jgi:hypothetical protein
MTYSLDDRARVVFAWARRLEPTEREVAEVLSRLGRSRVRPVRALTVAFASLVLLFGGIVAVPAGRAGVGDALGVLASFFDGGATPGRSIAAGEQPRWLEDVAAGSARILAQSGGERLYAYRTPSGAVCLAFGNHAAECDGDASWWRSLFDRHAVALFGPAPAASAGTAVAWGVAAASVRRVELRYADGSTETAAVTNGGFVLQAESTKGPRTIVALDSRGKALESQDVQGRQWTFCTSESGCG